jgi:uncharacterized membrane protein YsdA (DUF1294 family)
MYSEKLLFIMAAIYVALSITTFVVYAIDKSAAKNGRWRTKESTLHLFSLFGGWPGAYCAQVLLRHKSSKQAFKRVYWITVLVNLAGLYWLQTEKGINLINTIISIFI